MATFAALTGAAVVLATFHVTFSELKPATVTAVFGAVTRNGPAVADEVTVVDAVAMAPPPARLSRAVTWKVIVRLVVGRISPVKQEPSNTAHEYVCGGVLALLSTYVNFGNVR